MRLKILLLSSLLCGCTLVPVLESSDTFAVCKAGDVITTGYALSTGLFVEKNPLVAPFVSSGVGPLVFIGFVMWLIADRYNNPTANLVLNSVTCPVAAHNLWLLVK